MNPIINDLVKEIDVNQIETMSQFYELADAVARSERMDYLQTIIFNQSLYDKWVKSKLN